MESSGAPVTDRTEKRRRLSFSLRALVIVVMVLGVCWTLTATWGVDGLLYREPQESFTIVKNTNEIVVRRADPDGSVYEWKSRASVPLPFYVKVETHGRMPDGYESNWEDSYIWFFGYTIWLNRPSQSLRKR
jgi:hypothetical protein